MFPVLAPTTLTLHQSASLACFLLGSGHEVRARGGVTALDIGTGTGLPRVFFALNLRMLLEQGASKRFV